MCEICVNNIKEIYPELSEEDACDLLMSATSFPFGNPEDIRKRLLYLKENTDGTFGAAMTLNDKEFWQMDINKNKTKVMRKFVVPPPYEMNIFEKVFEWLDPEELRNPPENFGEIARHNGPLLLSLGYSWFRKHRRITQKLSL